MITFLSCLKHAHMLKLSMLKAPFGMGVFSLDQELPFLVFFYKNILNSDYLILWFLSVVYKLLICPTKAKFLSKNLSEPKS